MSQGEDFSGPWNDGKSPEMEVGWHYSKDPYQRALETNSLLEEELVNVTAFFSRL